MAALSINQKKRIRSLSHKKFRNELGVFMVEGDKMVREILHPRQGSIPFRVESLVATGEWLAAHGESIPGGLECVEVSPQELRQVSTQREPNGAIAVVLQAEYTPDISRLGETLTIALESIQDPGNLGTIIRTGDWFGIRDIFCSVDCVELYNPKLIQSTMGSFLRVRVHYLDLPELIGRIRDDITGKPAGNGTGDPGYQVFGTGSLGENPYDARLTLRGMILLGNESKGLSERLLACADRVLSIPRQDPDIHPDSLNVAASAAVLCAEFRRQGRRQ